MSIRMFGQTNLLVDGHSVLCRLWGNEETKSAQFEFVWDCNPTPAQCLKARETAIAHPLFAEHFNEQTQHDLTIFAPEQAHEAARRLMFGMLKDKPK